MSAHPIGQRFGDFEIVRELGQGGMGFYEARQVSLNRPVALKVLRRELALDDRARQRFRVEAEAAGKLHHTNIVPVYCSGEQDGGPYYVMELIGGPSLDRVLHHLRQVRCLADAPAPTVTNAPNWAVQTADHAPSGAPPAELGAPTE